jgi:hypothetical protein
MPWRENSGVFRAASTNLESGRRPFPCDHPEHSRSQNGDSKTGRCQAGHALPFVTSQSETNLATLCADLTGHYATRASGDAWPPPISGGQRIGSTRVKTEIVHKWDIYSAELRIEAGYSG